MEVDNETTWGIFEFMPDIVAACIVLHNICIVNNEGIEGYWIIEAESKLARWIIEGDVRENSELRGEKTGIAEVRKKILAREDVPIADEENDVETNLFLLRENEKANDLQWEATAMDETLAESLWQYKLRKNLVLWKLIVIVIVIVIMKLIEWIKARI
jgi:hypothetical protein